MRLVPALVVPCALAAACLAGCGDEARPAAAAAAPVAEPQAISVDAAAHRRARLAREVARLEAELGVVPDHLDGALPRRGQAADAAAYETWLITQERQDLRRRIERLRQRIVLLEQVGREQDLGDRADLTEAKNAGVAVHTDRAIAREVEADARTDREQARWLIAHRDAKRAQLERIRRELDAADAPPALPSAPPAVEMPVPAQAEAPPEPPSEATGPGIIVPDEPASDGGQGTEPIDPLRTPPAEAPSP